MNRFTKYTPGIAAAAAMTALILDIQTAIQAAAQAIEICVKTAIPSLFPFFVLSGILVPYASHLRLPFLRKLLKLPDGWESIFLLGCLGGYPVGAQCIAQGYSSGKLDREQAQRMLGFCTNCGPSFLFGIVGCALGSSKQALAVMLTGIISAIIVGMLWPCREQKNAENPQIPSVSLPQAVRQALRSMASVCAWIILGKVLLAFLTRWFLWRLSDELQLITTGMLELTNGCLMLRQCANEDLRFAAACAMTSFGGLCVAMQVRSLCADTGLEDRLYLPQKLLQSAAASILALGHIAMPGFLWIIGAVLIGIPILCKKTVEIPKTLVYNGGNKGGR